MPFHYLLFANNFPLRQMDPGRNPSAEIAAMASPPRRNPLPPSSPPPPAKTLPMEVEITVISAKHLKNVNWRRGDLKPCAVLYLDPDHRVTTKADDAGSTTPVWNERFVLPVPLSGDVSLTLEIFHSKPSETSKPLVGTARASLWDLVDNFSDGSAPAPIKTLEIRRPSGRPQGKVRIKIIVREIPPSLPMAPPDYHVPPPPSFYNYSSAPPPSIHGYASSPPPPYHHNPPPPPPAVASPYNRGGYSDPYSGYYSGGGYYSGPPPPPPPRPYYDAQSGYGVAAGPSAPVDYNTSGSSYHQIQRNQGKAESSSASAVGSVSGAFGGMSLREGSNYRDEKPPERAEGERMGRSDYPDRRDDY